MEKTVLHNKYSLVKGAARRARQLQGGAPPTIVSTSMKACRVAQDEICQGQVGYTLMASTLKDPSALDVNGLVKL